MGLFTRSKPPPDRAMSLTAAASMVRFDDEKSVKQTLAKHATWEDEAWAYYDEVPEIKFGVNFSGNAMTKVKFFAAVRDAEGAIVPVNDPSSPLLGTPVAIQADAEMARLVAEMGGQGELNRLAEINLEIPGQFYLFGKGAYDDAADPTQSYTETWDIIATECVVSDRTEVDEQNRPVVYVKDDPDQKKEDWYRVDPEKDTLIHAFMRHPRYKKRADSYMRALLTDCQTIVALNNQVLAESRSRMNAGLLLIPKEVHFEQSKNPKDPAEFVRDLVEALVTPIEDPSDQRSLVPPIVRGNKDDLTPDSFRRLDLSRTTDSQVDERILQRIDRIARGLNVPVEVVMGHMATTFANAEQVDQDTFDDHLEPKCRTIAEMYGFAFLRPQLIEAMTQMLQAVELAQILAEDSGVLVLEKPDRRGITIEEINQIFVWFDASTLVHAREPENTPEQALEHGAISTAAYRKRRNISEAEAPNPEELALQMAIKKGNFGQTLTAVMLSLGGMNIPAEFLNPANEPGQQQQGPSGNGNGLAPEAALVAALLNASPGSTPPDPFVRSDLGRALLAIDLDLRARVHGAAEAAMERALERAGGRLKSRKQVASVVGSVPATRVAAHLGPALVASTGYDAKSLLDGAWTVLERQFKEWCVSASDEAVRLIERATTAFDDTRLTAHRAQVRQAVDAGWDFLATELDVIGAARLYDPDGDGEIEAFGRIPTGVIREALTIAGGDTGVFTLIAAGAPTAPAGGVATGKLATDLANGNGVVVKAYRWVYGPAHRDHPFDPHVDLDGVEFVSFTDHELLNSFPWPPNAYLYPGDHVGCSCDIEPILTITTATREAIPAMAEAVREGGFTINPRTGQSVTSGYAVAPPNLSTIKSAEDFFAPGHAEQIIEAWLERNAYAFDDPDLNIGGWYDHVHDEIVLDPSMVVTAKKRALALAKKWDQQAIFHLDSFTEIATGGTGQRATLGASASVVTSPHGDEDLPEVQDQHRDEPQGPSRL